MKLEYSGDMDNLHGKYLNEYFSKLSQEIYMWFSGRDLNWIGQRVL